MTEWQPSGQDPGAALVRPFVAAGGGAVDTSTPFQPGPSAQTPIRPYLLTSGRAVSAREMPVEAQVMVTQHGRGAKQWLSFEYRDLVSLCDQPLAVAEIAARMNLHLGVIRVLITDLQEQGVLTTFQPSTEFDVDTILRVIDGLRQRA